MRRDDDLARVRRALGYRGAFDSLFDRYFGPVFRLALHRVQDEEAAQRMATRMLGHVFGSLEDYDGRVALDAWVLTRCRHVLTTPPSEPADRSLLEAAPGEPRRPR
jgi:hypothetical protein